MDARPSFDAYAPREIAERLAELSVAKTRTPFVPLVMLGILAGGFIGLGGLFSVIVFSDSFLSFAASRLLGGAVFSMGLLLVVVAGAELFTGNNLLAMGWADGRVTTREVLRNWVVVCASNFVGAAGLAAIVFLSGHAEMNSGAIGRTYLQVAAAKMALPFWTAFFRGVLCNALVCMAVWMTLAGRSVVDKFFAVLLPVAAFVAAGFEHSIANMYLLTVAMMLQASAGEAVNWLGLVRNLVPVILGNIVGGSVLVALVYYMIYRRRQPAAVAAVAPPAETARRA
ncbi:MAG TPA: formate/nitrite transporter family protein [Casimicrobiaceae bacterium]|nr:formate/nitrite transporter family protein [Casimicrobiaceae bacterium]